MKIWLPPLCFAFGATLLSQAPAAVRISEIQAENYGPFVDEEKDSGDWIELQNTGATEVDLAGWYLTDEKGDLTKWAFPKVLIPPSSQIVVFTDEKNRNGVEDPAKPSPVKPIHTNFRLGINGEYLALVKPDGKTIEHEWAPKYPQLAPQISYGIADSGQPGYFKKPTPGAANGPAEPFGPFIEEVTNLLADPKTNPAGQPDSVKDANITIATKVKKMESDVAKVTLFFRFQYNIFDIGPDQLAKTADDQIEGNAPMKDDGVAPDIKAGDGIYTANLPLAAGTGPYVLPGEMIRWRVEASDAQGVTNKLPLYHDAKDSAQYFGTVAKGTKGLIAGSEVIPAPLENSRLPIFHMFIERPTAAESASGTRCSIFYLNEFYDNVRADLHGQSTSGFPKKKPLNFDSNVHQRFKFKEGFARIKDMDLLTNYADKSKVRNHMAWDMYGRSGVPAHTSFPVRVQLNGAFHGTWDLLNDPDEEFLKEEGLNPEGALYKMYDNLTATSQGEKKTRTWEPKTDLQEFINGIRKGTATAKLDYGYDNINIAEVVNFICMNTIVNNTDFGHKNYYVYRDTTGMGVWYELPWDVDLSLGRLWTGTQNYFYDSIVFNQAPGNNNGNGPSDFIMNNADTKKMVYRRLRTLMDEYYGPIDGKPSSDYFMKKLDEIVEMFDPNTIEWSDAELDYKKNGTWSQTGNAVAKHTAAVAGTTDEMRREVERIRSEFFPKRRDFLYKVKDVPPAQGADLKVKITELSYLPDSGNQEEEYLVVRNDSTEDIDMTGWKVSGAIEHSFVPGTVLLTTSATAPTRGSLYLVKNWKAFRAKSASPRGGERLFLQGNYKGQLSARGEKVIITNAKGEVVTEYTYEGRPSEQQQNLRITEIMYAPKVDAGQDEGDYEYIEIQNIGAEPLNLEGANFVSGIEFTFGSGASLQPKQYGLLVRNKAAFESRYGAGKNILGEYKGRLNNGGDRIELEDVRDENVLSFAYKKEWSKEANEQGYSLVIRDASKPFDSWDLAESWASSPTGSPGAGDGALPPPPPASGYANWRKKHFGDAALANDKISGPLGDANGDGRANLLSYAFNLNPNNNGAADMPAIGIEPSGASVKYRRLKQASDLNYTIQTSSDMSKWTDLANPQGNVVPIDSDTEWHVVPLTKNVNFLRISVSLKP